MNLYITEVQLTCIILMVFMTFILAFSLPRHKKAGETANCARKILATGSLLIILHFIIQYNYHKISEPSVDIRAIINMFFGIPFSFCFNLSIIYIQRQGKIRKWEWLSFIVLYLLAILAILLAATIFYSPTSMHTAAIILSVLYEISLLATSFIEIKEYLYIKRAKSQNPQLASFHKWTQWSMLVMIFIGLGMPVMSLIDNLMYRAIYGIVTLSSGFFYIFSFIGYYLNDNLVPISASSKKAEKGSDEKVHLNATKTKQIEEAINELIQSKYHLQSGITQKDVAARLGISRNALNAYLQDTEYKKFNNWLMQLRLEEAKKMLLAHPDWSNETIAHECGFCNRAYFQSQFSEHIGMSPLKWIKEHQKSAN